MKMKKVSAQTYGKMVSSYLRGVNKSYYSNTVVGDWGTYSWKEQKNGLIKYSFKVSGNDINYNLVVASILEEIEKKNQIILREGKYFFTVMNSLQDVSECV